MKKYNLILLMMSLTGCASMTIGQNQTLSVETSPDIDASCELSNDKGKWFVTSTPGSVVVNRSYEDLIVVCKKGKKTGNTTISSHTKGMMYGNILAGGLIGAAVDAGAGAAYDYPSVIMLPLSY